MKETIKLFWQIFSKIALIAIFIAILMIIIFNRPWIVKQYDKAVGMYYIYKGDKAYKSFEMQKAINYYQQGLKLYPSHHSAWFNLGNLYVVYEDYYLAVKAYSKAVQYNKKYTLARMNLGIITAEKLGGFDDAITQYQAIIKNDRRKINIPFIYNNKHSEYYNKGIAYYNMGHAYRRKSMYYTKPEDYTIKMQYLHKSLEAYKKAAEILKNSYDVSYNLGLVYQLVGNYKQAGLSYCKAIDIEPMHYEAHYNLAILYKHLNLYSNALEELEKASVLASANTDTNPKYVFDVLSDILSTMVIKDIKDENIQEKNIDDSIPLINGKVKMSDELDESIIKNFRTCNTKVLDEIR